MIVQVINTVNTSSNMFSLLIPGSGWSASPNGCLNQFNGSYTTKCLCEELFAAIRPTTNSANIVILICQY
jgi:hypothetical protein